MTAFCVVYSTSERGNTKQRPSCYGALFWLIAYGKLIKPPLGVCWPVGRLIGPNRLIWRFPFLSFFLGPHSPFSTAPAKPAQGGALRHSPLCSLFIVHFLDFCGKSVDKLHPLEYNRLNCNGGVFIESSDFS